jgi:DNA-binding GntR family transcriptional regulator
MEVLGLTRSLLDDLRVGIVSGQFAPGEKVNESQLSSDLGISRGPLREALRILEKERLVVHIPRRGTFITETSLDDFTEIYQVREMIESYAIDILKESGIKELPLVTSALHEALGQSAPTPDSTPEERLAFIRGNAGFHIKLVESTGNSRLIQYYASISNNIARYTSKYTDLRLMSASQEKEHREILEAINKGSYSKAKNCLLKHIRSVAEGIKVRIVAG